MEGQRVHIDDQFCTIRYYGPVQGQEGVWAGLEWDDPTRGKHSGTVEGTTYYQTETEGAGSMMRAEVFAEKRARERTLREALLWKYTEHLEVDQAELYANTVRNNKKPIELLGTAEVLSFQQQLHNTQEVALQSLDISSIDDFGHLLPLCSSLLLDKNLLRDWGQMWRILRELPQLETLSLSYNRLTGPIDPADLTHNLKTLVLIGMHLQWHQILPLVPIFPQLKEILVCKNLCRDLAPITSPNLTLLNLESNGISSWTQVANCFRDLPSLEKLILNDNLITEIEYSGGFGRLVALSLNGNRLESWNSLHEIAKFPAGINELRISHNPSLQGNLSVVIFRSHAIARVPSLNHLNGAAVRPQERQDSERYYLRQYVEDLVERELPIYVQLRGKHGDLSHLGKMEAVGQVTIDSSAINIRLVSVAKASAGREFTKKLPLSISILALKSLCSKLFAVPVAGLKLTYRESKEQVMAETLDDNTKELSYYVMREGGELWVDDL